MFYGCTSLTYSPVIKAVTSPTAANRCCYQMFWNCKALTEVRINITTVATDSFTDWLYGVAASGDLYCYASLPTDSASGVPVGWAQHTFVDV